MKPYRGTVTEWEIHELPGGGELVFTGTVSEPSTAAKFPAGRHIRSSQIVQLRRTENYLEAETINSVYHLVGSGGDYRLREKGLTIPSNQRWH